MVCDIKVSQEQFFTEIIASHMMFNCGAKVLDNFILDGFVSWPVSREWSEFKSKITSVRLYLDILVKIENFLSKSEGFWPSLCSNTGPMSKWGKVKPKKIEKYHDSYKWMILLEKCGLPDVTVSHLIWIIGNWKKIKSWGPFWSYQLNSNANPVHLPQIWAKWAELAVLFSR